MRILFMAAGEIALPTLRWLIGHHEKRNGDELVGVYTQPDKPIGRKQLLTAPEVKRISLEHGIPVRQPETLKGNESALAEYETFRPDLTIVMAYGQILPRRVISASSLACVNLHASLLPRHRGASPIQAAIREGDGESGITLMHVIPKLDAGDMILKETVKIEANETGESLHDRIAELGPRLMERSLPMFHSGRFTGEPQDEHLVTHCGKLGREDGALDWSMDAAYLERFIRAYEPWPGTTTTWCQGGETRKLKIHPPTAVLPGNGSTPGTVIESAARLVVSCGSGALVLNGEVQLEGRRRLPVADFLRGADLPAGTILG